MSLKPASTVLRVAHLPTLVTGLLVLAPAGNELSNATASGESPGPFSVLFASTDESPTGPSEKIYEIDQTTGRARLIGPSGLLSPLDLTSDWRRSSARIWACESETNQLLLIDPETGLGTSVGPFVTPTPMESIAFDVESGKLFGSTTDDTLYEIDPDTGATTPIGPLGFPNVFSLGFDRDGTLYGTSTTEGKSSLLIVDTRSGSAREVAETNLTSISDLAVRPEDGSMFAADTASDAIYTLDLATGAATLVGSYGSELDFVVGLAFLRSALPHALTDPPPVPAFALRLRFPWFPWSLGAGI